MKADKSQGLHASRQAGDSGEPRVLSSLKSLTLETREELMFHFEFKGRKKDNVPAQRLL